MIRKKDGFTSKVDIWALGGLVLEMLTGFPPWHDTERANLIFRIGSGNIPSLPPFLSEIASLFIHTTFKINPEERPTASELLDHEFIKIDITLVDFKSWIAQRQAIIEIEEAEALKSDADSDSDVYIDLEELESTIEDSSPNT